MEEERFVAILKEGQAFSLSKTFDLVEKELIKWRGKEEFADDVSMMGLEF